MTTKDLITHLEQESGGEFTPAQEYEITAIVGANPIDKKIYELVASHVFNTFYVPYS